MLQVLLPPIFRKGVLGIAVFFILPIFYYHYLLFCLFIVFVVVDLLFGIRYSFYDYTRVGQQWVGYNLAM